MKNSRGPIGFGNFEAMDIMRGEEVESIALLEQYPRGKSYLLVLPGSHMKFVSVNTKGQITGCLTSISGELACQHHQRYHHCRRGGQAVCRPGGL